MKIIKIAVITMMGMSLGVIAQTNKIELTGNVGIGITNPTYKVEWYNNTHKGFLDFTFTGVALGSKTGDFSLYSNGIRRFFIGTNGNVGIGTNNPSSKLELMNGNNGISFDSSDDWIGIGFNRSVRNGQIFDTTKSGWQFTARDDRFSLEGYNGAFSNLLHILKNGNIGIGTKTTGNHKLAVEGSIGAREIKVEANGWSDFVFEKNYDLPTLLEVESHIKEKGHLKDIPSAKEVTDNGIYLGEMNSKLLQKIEELTLYTIQQEKKIKKLAKENESLKLLTTKFLELQKRLEKLEKK